MLVDHLLPAAVAASRSSRQWEKEPGRRAGRAEGREAAKAHSSGEGGGGGQCDTEELCPGISLHTPTSPENKKRLCPHVFIIAEMYKINYCEMYKKKISRPTADCHKDMGSSLSSHGKKNLRKETCFHSVCNTSNGQVSLTLAFK